MKKDKAFLLISAVAAVGLFFWLKKKTKGKSVWPPNAKLPEPSYALDTSVSVPGVPQGLAPLSHFAPMGSLNLDSPEDYYLGNFGAKNSTGITTIVSHPGSVKDCRAACGHLKQPQLHQCVVQCQKSSRLPAPTPVMPASGQCPSWYPVRCQSGACVTNSNECGPVITCPPGQVFSQNTQSCVG